VIVVTGKCYLLQVVLTGHAGRGFTDLLYSRKEKANEDCDDRDDNEQFDQSEPAARGSAVFYFAPKLFPLWQITPKLF
jgi:hypothetical protein